MAIPKEENRGVIDGYFYAACYDERIKLSVPSCSAQTYGRCGKRGRDIPDFGRSRRF